MVEEGKFWCHNFSLHGVGFKSLEMYCNHNFCLLKICLIHCLVTFKKKKKRREFNKIRNEKKKITTDMTEKQRIMLILQATI